MKKSLVKSIATMLIAGMGILALFPVGAGAQWVQTNGPWGGKTTNAYFLVVIGNNLFAGTWNFGVQLSIDSGNTWNGVNNGLTSNMTWTLGVSDNMLFASFQDGTLFRSTNNGLSWTKVYTMPYGYSLKVFSINGIIFFSGNIGGDYRSTDSGTTWTHVTLPPSVSTLFRNGVKLFAGTSTGVFCSTDSGTTWTAVNTGLPAYTDVRALAASGTYLFAGTNNGVFRSADSSIIWVQVNSGLIYSDIRSLAVSGMNIFASTSGGVFYSSDSGLTWTAASPGLPPYTSADLHNFAVIGNNLFMCGDSGVFRSTNNGSSWTAVNRGLEVNTVKSIMVRGGNMLAGTNTGRYGSFPSTKNIFLSSNNGTNWTVVNSSVSPSLVYGDGNALAVSGNIVFAGGNGALRSADNGANWTQVNSGLTNTDVLSLLVNDSNLFAGVNGPMVVNTTNNPPTEYGVYRSTDSGTSWTKVNSGLPYIFLGTLYSSGTYYYSYTTISVISLAVIDTTLFAGTDRRFVYRSTDNGTNWIQVNSGLTDSNIQCLAARSNNIFAGTKNNGVFLSTDNGTSWTAVNTGLTNTNILSLFVNNTDIFAGTNGGGVFRSTDSGKTWNEFNTGLTQMNIYSLDVNGNDLLAGTGTFGGRVWRRPLSDVSVKHPQNSLPDQFSFNLLTHNLSNRSITIAFSLPRADKVMVKIYNLSGHLIATLCDKPLSTGPHSVSWDTRNVASGCYMVRMQAGQNSQVKAIPLFR